METKNVVTKEKKARKEIIKTVAIIFLAVVLVLTLFSNTIMNYSLTEVGTQEINGDSLTTKVRGSGTVEAAESFSITMPDTRKIESFAVKVGSSVEVGEVVAVLADGESDELKAKKAELEAAEVSYESTVLESGLTVSERTAVESGKTSSLTAKQQAREAAQKKIDDAQKKVDTLTAQATSNSKVDTSKEEAALTKAQQDKIASDALVERAEGDASKAQQAYEMAIEAGDADLIASTKSAYETAYNACVAAKQAAVPYEQAVTNAQNALSAKLEGDGGSSTELTNATAELEKAREEYQELTNKQSGESAVATAYKAMIELREEVAEMSGESTGGQVKTTMAGTVTEIMYVPGQTVAKDEILMTIKPEDKGYTMNITITADQARKIKIGDDAKVVDNWWGRDIKGTVRSIRKSPENKDQNLVGIELSGEVNVGESYTVSIGEKSSNYDMVVPTSAIREDSNGKFIYKVESKNTPLGNRYYARRVDVVVLASDDTNSAISGNLEPWGEYIITTTTKPIEENQQVRLAD